MILKDKMILLWPLFGLLSMSESQNALFPSLPMGEYRIIYEAINRCQYSNNDTLEFNLYFSKKSRNLTEIKGNMTYHVPFDDNLVLEVNFSSWSLRGGWVENSYVQQFDNLCTSFKMLAGKFWSPVNDAFHFPTKKCPLPKGTYTTSGLDVRYMDGHNFPKVFFYGKYKLKGKVKYKNNTLAGCVALDIKLVRPWELPNQ